MPVPLIAASSAATGAFRPVSGLVSGIGRRLGIGHRDVEGERDPNVPKIRAMSDRSALQVISQMGVLPADAARAYFNINAPINFGDGKVGRAYEAQVARERLAELGPPATTAPGSAGGASSVARGMTSEPVTASAGGVSWGPIALIGGGLAVAYFAFKGR